MQDLSIRELPIPRSANSQPDHFITDCPEPRPPREAREPRAPPAGYVCKACGKADLHYIRECPLVKEREEEKTKRKQLGAGECKLNEIMTR